MSDWIEFSFQTQEKYMNISANDDDDDDQAIESHLNFEFDR